MPRIEFDPKVSAGHLLTGFGLLLAGLAFVYGMDAKITKNDYESKARDVKLEAESKSRDKDLSAQLQRTAEAIARLERQLGDGGN